MSSLRLSASAWWFATVKVKMVACMAENDRVEI